jgi:ribosomal protein S18 acetylase RimI-like enzyme
MMPEPLMRPVTQQDCVDLLILLNTLSDQAKVFFHPHPFTMEALRKNLLSGDHYYVMAMGGTIVGYSFLRLFDTDIPSYGCCIRTGFDHHGYGTLMTRWTLAQASKLGYKKVILKVYLANLPALQLYRKVGFQEVAELEKTKELRMEIIL